MLERDKFIVYLSCLQYVYFTITLIVYNLICSGDASSSQG